MALFGKKETEGESVGVEPLPAKRNMTMEQKKSDHKSPPSAAAKDTSKDTTYLGKNLKINGNVSGEGNLIILGTFDGDFELKGQLKVAQGAVIKGNIKVFRSVFRNQRRNLIHINLIEDHIISDVNIIPTAYGKAYTCLFS